MRTTLAVLSDDEFFTFIKAFLFTFILYLSSVVPFDNKVLLALPCLFFFSFLNTSFSLKQYISFLLLLLIAGASLANNAFGVIRYNELPSLPYVFLFIVTYVAALQLTQMHIRFFLLLLLIETSYAALQYAAGVSAFDRLDPCFWEFVRPDLYYRKASGFSNSSSTLSYKILLGLLLVPYSGLRLNHKVLFSFAMCCGLIVAFNRTVILSSVVLAGLYFLRNEAVWKKIIMQHLTFSLLILLALSGGVLAFLLKVLSRDKGKFDMSGRGDIWSEYLNFISDHLLWGAHSFKHFVTTSLDGYWGILFHAHNSFLMFLASNGLVIGSLFLLFVMMNFSRRACIPLLGLFVYSLAQYGILWGISLLDVFFMMFLVNNTIFQPINYPEQVCQVG